MAYSGSFRNSLPLPGWYLTQEPGQEVQAYDSPSTCQQQNSILYSTDNRLEGKQCMPHKLLTFQHPAVFMAELHLHSRFHACYSSRRVADQQWFNVHYQHHTFLNGAPRHSVAAGPCTAFSVQITDK